MEQPDRDESAELWQLRGREGEGRGRERGGGERGGERGREEEREGGGDEEGVRHVQYIPMGMRVSPW